MPLIAIALLSLAFSESGRAVLGWGALLLLGMLVLS